MKSSLLSFPSISSVRSSFAGVGAHFKNPLNELSGETSIDLLDFSNIPWHLYFASSSTPRCSSFYFHDSVLPVNHTQIGLRGSNFAYPVLNWPTHDRLTCGEAEHFHYVFLGIAAFHKTFQKCMRHVLMYGCS